MLGVQGGRRRVTDPLELEPQMVVGRRVVLGTELGATTALCCAFSPVPYLAFQDCLSVTWS